LTDGYHNLSVHSLSRNFLVNATGFHTPELLSPINTNYTKNSIPLTFTCDQNKYTVYYNFNNSGYTAITSNTTLSGLADGRYTITIKAMNGDIAYSQQQLTIFNVNTTKSNVSIIDDNQAVILVGAVSAVSVLLIVAILLYRRRKISK